MGSGSSDIQEALEMNVKQGDYVLSLLEFFGIILPGALLCFLFLPEARYILASLDIQEVKGYQEWIAFIVISYLAGYYVNYFGRTIRVSYNRLLFSFEKLRTYHRHRDIGELHSYVSRQMHRAFGASEMVTYYVPTLAWATSFVRQKSPLTAMEIERMQASSDFFVNFSVVLLLISVKWIVIGNIIAALVTIGLSVFSFFVFRHLTTEILRFTYTFYIVLEKLNGDSEAIEDSSRVADEKKPTSVD
jgi:hypothetical protein